MCERVLHLQGALLQPAPSRRLQQDSASPPRVPHRRHLPSAAGCAAAAAVSTCAVAVAVLMISAATDVAAIAVVDDDEGAAERAPAEAGTVVLDSAGDVGAATFSAAAGIAQDEFAVDVLTVAESNVTVLAVAELAATVLTVFVLGETEAALAEAAENSAAGAAASADWSVVADMSAALAEHCSQTHQHALAQSDLCHSHRESVLLAQMWQKSANFPWVDCVSNK